MWMKFLSIFREPVAWSISPLAASFATNSALVTASVSVCLMEPFAVPLMSFISDMAVRPQ